MVFISHNSIDDVIDEANNNIVDIIGKEVELRRRGTNYVGKCPFHDEKTPSFIVSPSKGIYKCFGCGNAGNSIKFVMEINKISFPEAIIKIAEEYNIPIEVKENKNKENYLEERTNEKIFYKINQLVFQYSQRELRQNSEAQDYLKQREFSDEIVKEIGYIPPKTEELIKYVLDRREEINNPSMKKSELIEKMQEIGILIRNRENLIIRYGSRIIFPIKNLNKQITGFSGRIIDNKTNSAKYLNSPESNIFSKRKILFGLEKAKNTILKQDKAIIVEGYTDVFRIRETIGEKYAAVSSMGTSITEEQIKLLKRFTKNFIILLDGDLAGLKASNRTLKDLIKQDINVKVKVLPENEDPDSYLRKSKQAIIDFEKLPEYNLLEFKTFIKEKELNKKFNEFSPDEKSDLLMETIDDMIIAPNNLKNLMWLENISKQFGKPMIGEAYINKVHNLSRKKHHLKELRKTREDDHRQTNIIIKYLTSDELVAKSIETEIKPYIKYFNEMYQEILEFAIEERKQRPNEFPIRPQDIFNTKKILLNKLKEKIGPEKFISFLGGYETNSLLKDSFENKFSFDDVKKVINEAINDELNKLSKELQKAVMENKDEDINNIMKQMKVLTDELRR